MRREVNEQGALPDCGPFVPNTVVCGDSMDLIPQLSDESIDIIVTSPPYWGQRAGQDIGCEEDPREYLEKLTCLFAMALPKVKKEGVVWINIGDTYNVSTNWDFHDFEYSTLNYGKKHPENNSAFSKDRGKRKAFLNKEEGWLSWGNLLGLGHRLAIALVEKGFLYRGEVIWSKKNPLPEGRCVRPHRRHEPIYLFARNHRHNFRVSPPVGSVWNFSSNSMSGQGKGTEDQNRHFSRFPIELPVRCIDAYGKFGPNTLVLDPFSGSGTTGIAAIKAGCSYIGFEIDEGHAENSNKMLATAREQDAPLLRHCGALPHLQERSQSELFSEQVAEESSP